MTNSVWQATIQNAAGDTVGGAEITVIDESTGLEATIFSSRAGAALANPFLADGNGFAQFFAVGGEYRITAYDDGTGLTQTFNYVRLGTGGSTDVGTSATRDTGTATGQVLLSEDAGLNSGDLNLTSGNLNNNISDGVGSRIWAVNISGSSVPADTVIAGSGLRPAFANSSGVVLGGTPLTGTYRNVSNISLGVNEASTFVKVS